MICLIPLCGCSIDFQLKFSRDQGCVVCIDRFGFAKWNPPPATTLLLSIYLCLFYLCCLSQGPKSLTNNFFFLLLFFCMYQCTCMVGAAAQSHVVGKQRNITAMPQKKVCVKPLCQLVLSFLSALSHLFVSCIFSSKCTAPVIAFFRADYVLDKR